MSARMTGATAGGAMAHEFVVDVRLENGELIREQVETPKHDDDFRAPEVGEVVGVEVEHKGRKLRFDTSDPRLSRRATRRARFDAASAAAAGSPAAALQGLFGAGAQGIAVNVTAGGQPLDVAALLESLAGTAGALHGGHLHDRLHALSELAKLEGAGNPEALGRLAGLAGGQVTGSVSSHVTQVDPDSPQGRQIVEMTQRLLAARGGVAGTPAPPGVPNESFPQASGTYTAGNGPYAGGNGPYAGGNGPVPTANEPFGGNSPLPGQPFGGNGPLTGVNEPLPGVAGEGVTDPNAPAPREPLTGRNDRGSDPFDNKTDVHWA